MNEHSPLRKLLRKKIRTCECSFISQNTIALSHLIETHVKRFRKVFSESNVTPKKHYTIHIPSHTRRLELLVVLPGVTLRSVCVASWVTSYGTKYKRGALAAYDVDHATFLPKFGKRDTGFLIHGFIYFEVFIYNTVQLSEMLQSYEMTESFIRNSKVVFYESLLDYNVYH